MSGWVELHGRGLHTGVQSSVRFDARPGPLLFLLGPDEAGLDELTVVRADQGVCLRSKHGSHAVELCEHLLSALAGTSIRSGLVVTLPGPEVPLLDGGAGELARALVTLGIKREATRLAVTRRAELDAGESRYRFEPADTPVLEVEVDFADGRVRERAEHRASVERYLTEIAPARTFGFEHDAEALRSRGRARHVDPYAVAVLDSAGRVLPPAAPLEPGELARHKLLDLMGDLFLFGGPPRGRVVAERPGHAATHRVVAEALATGVISRA